MAKTQQKKVKSIELPKESLKEKGFFHGKSILIALGVLIVFLLITQTPRYGNVPTETNPIPGWFSTNIMGYYKDFSEQWKDQALDKRMLRRHGYNYFIPDYITKNVPKNAVFLVPPDKYFEKKLQQGAGLWAQVPRVLYYFAGPMKTVYLADSNKAEIHGKIRYVPNHVPSRMISVVSPNDSVQLSKVTHSFVVMPDKNFGVAPIQSYEQLQQLISEFTSK